jgi:hypothetical protein
MTGPATPAEPANAPGQARPPFLDAPVPDPYPFPESHDVRTDPRLHPALDPLLPFIGVWRGRGSGEYPTIEPFEYAQELRISHDGRPFVSYESRSWLVRPDGEPVRPAAREVGWWRVVTAEGQDPQIEALFCLPTGIMEQHYGRVSGVRLDLASEQVLRTSSAKAVTAGSRIYRIIDGDLYYAQDMKAVGQELRPHLAAKLARVAG